MAEQLLQTEDGDFLNTHNLSFISVPGKDGGKFSGRVLLTAANSHDAETTWFVGVFNSKDEVRSASLAIAKAIQSGQSLILWQQITQAMEGSGVLDTVLKYMGGDALAHYREASDTD